MAEKKDREKRKEMNKVISKNIDPIHKIWKILAIVFITLFLLIMVAGLFRLYHPRSSFKQSTESDIASAKSAVYDYMISNGRNVSIDNITPFDRVTKINYNNTSQEVLGVLISGQPGEEMFLVDINSKEVLMHSTTEFYGWLNSSRKMPFRNPRFDMPMEIHNQRGP